ncbi:MAG TPA: anti-sigma factor [Frankiaceae bacterium]|nr:anti-sigma factor [Frankiaceae bacterium]
MTVHLGELATALVDGQLDHDRRDWALAHLAHCARCQAEVDVQRRLKARLAALREPSLPADLAGRLLALRTTPVAPSPSRSVPGFPAPPAPKTAVRPPVTSRPPGRPAAASRPAAPATTTGASRPARDRARGRGRGRRVLLGSATVLLLGAAGVFALGGGAGSGAGQPVTPPVGTYVQQHGATSRGLPLSDPALTAVSTSFSR